MVRIDISNFSDLFLIFRIYSTFSERFLSLRTSLFIFSVIRSDFFRFLADIFNDSDRIDFYFYDFFFLFPIIISYFYFFYVDG